MEVSGNLDSGGSKQEEGPEGVEMSVGSNSKAEGEAGGTVGIGVPFSGDDTAAVFHQEGVTSPMVDIVPPHVKCTPMHEEREKSGAGFFEVGEESVRNLEGNLRGFLQEGTEVMSGGGSKEAGVPTGGAFLPGEGPSRGVTISGCIKLGFNFGFVKNKATGLRRPSILAHHQNVQDKGASPSGLRPNKRQRSDSEVLFDFPPPLSQGRSKAEC
ncbi:hypothetical protein Hanom_Chr07g00630141 [Helianthus anomalus]